MIPARADHQLNPTRYPICGTCGTVWAQHGNRTGHCAKCHQTFEGLSLFDRHQTLNDDGSVNCRDGADMTYKHETLTNADGVWFGPRMTQEANNRRFGSQTQHRARTEGTHA